MRQRHGGRIPKPETHQPRLPDAGSPSDAPRETPRFDLIFGTVVALTVLALLVNVVLALLGDGSAQVKTVADACSTTYKMGFGAIVGLLGGRRQ